MARQAKAKANAADGKPTLGEFIDALSGVIGHQVPANLFLGTVLADALGKDPAQFSRMRNSRTASPLELLKLLRVFRLERAVDYRIFDNPDIDSFLADLRSAGVGIYGGSSRAQLLGLLSKAAKAGKASIALEVVSRPVMRARGLGPPEEDDPSIPVLVQGTRVRLVCTGPANRHLIILQHVGEGEVEILMPSRVAPRTQVSQAVTMIPTPESDLDVLTVRTEPGFCRLFAAWVDATVAERLHLALAEDRDTTALDDPTATALCRLLESATDFTAATLTFRTTVVGS